MACRFSLWCVCAHPDARCILLPKRCSDKLLQGPALVLCQRLGGEQQQGTGVAVLGKHLCGEQSDTNNMENRVFGVFSPTFNHRRQLPLKYPLHMHIN